MLDNFLNQKEYEQYTEYEIILRDKDLPLCRCSSCNEVLERLKEYKLTEQDVYIIKYYISKTKEIK